MVFMEREEEEFTIRYASLRNSSRVSERLRGEFLRRVLCLLRKEARRGVRSDIVCCGVVVGDIKLVLICLVACQGNESLALNSEVSRLYSSLMFALLSSHPTQAMVAWSRMFLGDRALLQTSYRICYFHSYNEWLSNTLFI